MLAPCTSCQRHVRIDELRCPFCDCETPRATPCVALVGRLSRIAVFTSALVVANACGAPQKTGAVRGIALWSGGNMFGTQSGVVKSAKVTLRSHDGRVRTTKTDEDGEFEFDDVPVGTYSVILVPKNHGYSAWSEPVHVEVHENSVENVNLASHVALPYGAPPARRRMV